MDMEFSQEIELGRGLVASSNMLPAGVSPLLFTSIHVHYRGLAQLVERTLWEREVTGSSPVSPTERSSKCIQSIVCSMLISTSKEPN